MSVTINEGTQTDILTTQIGGTETGIVRLDVGVGTTRSDFGGTINNVLTQGTLGSVQSIGVIHNAGTIQTIVAGTINQATVSLEDYNVETGRLPVNLMAGEAAIQGNTGVVTTNTVRTTLATNVALPAGDNNIGNIDIVTGTVNRVHDVGTIQSIVPGGGATNLGKADDAAMTTGDTGVFVLGVRRDTPVTEGANNSYVPFITDSTGRIHIGSVVQMGSLAALGQVHNAGTIQAGTTQFNARPVTSILSQGTLGTAGGSFFATISAASGSGTRTWVTNVDIVMQSGTADVRILAGSAIQGTGVIAAGAFPAGGGIAKHFHPAFDAGDNSALLYHFVGAGTAFITVNYFKST